MNFVVNKFLCKMIDHVRVMHIEICDTCHIYVDVEHGEMLSVGYLERNISKNLKSINFFSIY